MEVRQSSVTPLEDCISSSDPDETITGSRPGRPHHFAVEGNFCINRRNVKVRTPTKRRGTITDIVHH